MILTIHAVLGIFSQLWESESLFVYWFQKPRCFASVDISDMGARLGEAGVSAVWQYDVA